MFDRSDEKFKPIEVSAGLLTGYFIVGLLNMMITGKAWNEAFIDGNLLTGFVGVSVSLFLYSRHKRKATESKD